MRTIWTQLKTPVVTVPVLSNRTVIIDRQAFIPVPECGELENGYSQESKYGVSWEIHNAEDKEPECQYQRSGVATGSSTLLVTYPVQKSCNPLAHEYR